MIRALAAHGITVVIIEHTMHAMVRLAEQLLVLDHGRVLPIGVPARGHAESRASMEAYLGKKWVMAGAAD